MDGMVLVFPEWKRRFALGDGVDGAERGLSYIEGKHAIKYLIVHLM